MKAAVVRAAGASPVWGDIAAPAPATGERLIAVTAAALSHVVRARASGRHYSAGGAYPFVIGVDGVGRLADGTRVYFVLPSPPNGAMAEETVVPAAQCIPLPAGLDDATAAAIANPGMSSWAAYVERARLKPGETVLVNGATGASGRLAVQIAKHLGAARVIATGRNAEALGAVATLGADATIALTDDADALEARLMEQFAAGIDVVVDYLWGASAERTLIAAAKAGRDATPMRYVQVGSASGETITLPGAVLRASAIELMGSGTGSIPLPRLIETVGALFGAAVPAGLRIATRTMPLADIARAWADDGRTGRLVLTS